MFKTVGAIAVASCVLLLAGCGPKAPTPTVNDSMTKVMAPHTQTIWDITSNAFNAKGDGLDPSKISSADWARLEAAGRALRDRALVLAEAKHVTAAAPGEHIMGQEAAGAASKIGHEWDAANATRVQAMIDANPALFAERARVLADAGDTIVKAVPTRNVSKLYEVSSGMDEVCDGCHQKFWGTDDPPPFPRK